MINKCNNEDVEKFNNTILVEKKDSDLEEVIKVIEMNKNDDEFYNLCYKYLDIALNADKWIDKESNNLMCCNRFVDINIAAEYTDKFIKKYNLSNVEGLVDMIGYRYVQSITPYETRKIAGAIPEKDIQKRNIGYFGKYYIFSEIPSWEQVKNNIIDKIVENKDFSKM
jgi:hypothetical protein